MIVRLFWLTVVGLALAWAARGAAAPRLRAPDAAAWRRTRPVEADIRAR